VVVDNRYTRQALRVNLAGERGACAIYKGQIASLKNSHLRSVVEHMYKQEQNHAEIFTKLARQREVRPTVFSGLWDGLGYGLGKITALMGDDAAMICTLAVEDVIDGHYQEQINRLQESEPHLTQVLCTCQAEEVEHFQKANEVLQSLPVKPWHNPLANAIRWGTRCAIALSKAL